MPATPPTPIEQQLTQALDDLATALKQASDAAATIRNIAPRIAATGSVLDEIEALLRTGRTQVGSSVADVPAPPAPYPGPTLVVPAAPAPRPRSLGKRKPDPGLEPVAGPSTNGHLQDAAAPERQEAEEVSAAFPNAADDPGVSCFRLEFESIGGPLDLRAIDDAVTQQPVVRDVALLDYDGRRATLKVWITAGASPAEVQSDLKERMPAFLAPGSDVRVIALEDVA